MEKGCFTAIILGLVFSSTIQAQDKAQADSTHVRHKNLIPTLTIDRPDQTDSPYVIPVGFFQIETGIQHHWDRYQEDSLQYSYRSITYPNLLLRYGLMKGVEIRLEENYGVERVKPQDRTQDKTTGLYPALLAAKIKLFDQKGLRPNIAVLVKVFTPFHTRKELDLTHKFTPGLVGAFSHSISDRFVLDGSIGAYIDQTTGDIVSHYSLSQAVGFTEKLSMFAEVFCINIPGEPSQYAADTGLLYMLRPNLQLDVYVSKSISYHAIDIYAGAGIGIRFPR
ncbi:transporter [Rhodocytophaga rosea]|uniref:Transporter n=1 Tax=Rhodocytophaga rosea TaxID=2704465 RepID=A0A6C0GGM3_9BACT|nr:transporter [Rhodocytophaga rosea]QHT66882.1 transporter [Rhodocytophaga rosea]